MKWSGKDVQAEFFPNAISGRMFLQYFLPLLCPEWDKLPKDSDREVFWMLIIPCQRIQILLRIGSTSFPNRANGSQNRSTLTFA